MGKLALPHMVTESFFWLAFTVHKSVLTSLFLSQRRLTVKDKGMSLRDLDISSANYSVCSCLSSHCVLYINTRTRAPCTCVVQELLVMMHEWKRRLYDGSRLTC